MTLLVPSGMSPSALALGGGDRIRTDADAVALSPGASIPCANLREDEPPVSSATAAAIATGAEIEPLLCGILTA